MLVFFKMGKMQMVWKAKTRGVDVYRYHYNYEGRYDFIQFIKLLEMGIYLSTPKTEKFSEDGENSRLRYGLSSMQGWRATMEDAHAALTDLDSSTSFFGVYDGHGET
ncbi:hypothetical protein RJ639_030294 [Escallonia herrerae]|uniref:protein-serine/threonine phosphatase n=1 Tax=Escallonia herrerae TaxID=1293975 RepID=A0AA88X1J1_9ASTE|nr:hypothetical protein RJ639_030294 [Escallonia herrerae]